MEKIKELVTRGKFYFESCRINSWNIALMECSFCVLQMYMNDLFVRFPKNTCKGQHDSLNTMKRVYFFLNFGIVLFLYYNKHKKLFQTKIRIELYAPVALLVWLAVSLNIIYPIRESLLVNSSSIWSLFLSPVKITFIILLYIAGLPFTMRQGFFFFYFNDQHVSKDIHAICHVELDGGNLITVLVFMLICLQLTLHGLQCDDKNGAVKLLRAKYESNEELAKDKLSVKKIFSQVGGEKVDEPTLSTVNKGKPVNVTKPLSYTSKSIVFPKSNEFINGFRQQGHNLSVADKSEQCNMGSNKSVETFDSANQCDLKLISISNSFMQNNKLATPSKNIVPVLPRKNCLKNGIDTVISKKKSVTQELQCNEFSHTTNFFLGAQEPSLKCNLRDKSSQYDLRINQSLVEKGTQSIIRVASASIQCVAEVSSNYSQTKHINLTHKKTQCYDTTPSYNKMTQVDDTLTINENAVDNYTQTTEDFHNYTEKIKYDIREKVSNRKIISQKSFNNNLKEKGCQTDLVMARNHNDTTNISDQVDSITYSATTMSDKTMKQTEPIRFKACKSQHGVWYALLRGDVFLSVSQHSLHTTALLEDQNERFLSRDILRTMKTFVENYRKLSNCFEDDEESDDESFINGFRL